MQLKPATYNQPVSEKVFTAFANPLRHYGVMTKQPYSNFDLPRQHLSQEGHYVPPKARDPEEIARRRTLPAGTVLAEQQAKGVEIAHTLLGRTEVGSDMKFVTHMVGMLTINASWYLFGRGAPDVMRRRLILPHIARYEDDSRLSAAELRENALEGLGLATDMAADFAGRYAERKLSVHWARGFARHLGNVALDLAVLGDGNTTISGNAFAVQEHVRSQALDLLEYARQSGIDTGTHPSVAQLPDRYSQASLNIHKNGPDNVVQTYDDILAVSS